MIETITRVGPLTIRTKWFAEQPSWSDVLALTSYVQSGYNGPRLGFVRRTFQTRIIDLTASEDEIFRQFSKKTQYEIRRARRDGVTCHFDGDAATFRRFHDDAVKRQGRRPVPPGLIESAGSNACISYARLEDRILVMSCMLIDPTLRRVRGWFGCSCHVPGDTSEYRQLVGRANRLLYFEEMRYFKSQGLEIYDVGGYSADTSNQKQMAINAFKEGFGGRLLIEANYVSYPLFLAVRARKLLTGLRRPANPGRWRPERSRSNPWRIAS